MYNTLRKLHRWIGVIFAIFFLAQAITGLMLAEPWLAGQSREVTPQGIAKSQLSQQDSGVRQPPVNGEKREANSSSLLGIAKGLHQGRIGNLSLTWLVDLSGIGIIILTVTGLYLSWFQFRNRRR